MSLVMRACHYIYVLDFGKLLAKGKPEEIRSNEKVVAAYLGEASSELEPKAAPKAGGVLLQVTGLAAGYGPMEVVRDVDLQVRAGEVVACIGANGAGKTTTLRAISGMIRPRAGTVVFESQDITRKSPETIARLGLAHIPQGRGLFPKLTVEETLRLASYSGGDGDLGPAYKLFPKLGQRRRQLVGTLSGGEQQMVAMARAILVKPKLVFIDEMSQGLAPTVVQELFRLLDTFRQEGVSVFLVEQFVDSALAVADRAYIFEQGTIAHEADAAELRRDKKLIASSYLGAAAELKTPNHTNGHHPLPAELMDDLMLKLPADLKRALEAEAAGQGRPTQAVVLGKLGGRPG
jgi:ABC-type branched-subunit amino acid transport system ATPase component